MKLIKLGLISLLLLVVLVLGMAVLIPSHVRISRAIDITAPREKLLRKIGDLRSWPQWNEFVNDSLLKSPSINARELKAGNLEIRILKSTGDSIVASWKTDQQTIIGGFNLIPSQDQFVVQWYFDFNQRWYPWEKFASIGFDKQYGPSMEKSLNLLKKQVEE